jgi:hypothetical protein
MVPRIGRGNKFEKTGFSVGIYSRPGITGMLLRFRTCSADKFEKTGFSVDIYSRPGTTGMSLCFKTHSAKRRCKNKAGNPSSPIITAACYNTTVLATKTINNHVSINIRLPLPRRVLMGLSISICPGTTYIIHTIYIYIYNIYIIWTYIWV